MEAEMVKVGCCLCMPAVLTCMCTAGRPSASSGSGGSLTEHAYTSCQCAHSHPAQLLPPLQVVPASAAAMGGSLGAALEAEPVPAFEQAPLGTRRVCFLSGMYAAEVMETISAYREIGEAPAEVAISLRWLMSRWRLAVAEVSLPQGQDGEPASIIYPTSSRHCANTCCTLCLPAPVCPCCRPARSCVCGSGA
jgi:hypothetical protein